MDSLANSLRRLKKLLQKWGRSREDAEDLIQEAFLRMQVYCERGGEIRAPEAFLARIATRLAINAKRDAHSELFADERVEDLTFIVDPRPTPDEVFIAEECLNRMRDRLDAASRRTREVFFLHRLDGLSYAQIATQMNLSVSSIEKHIASAMAILDDESEQERS